MPNTNPSTPQPNSFVSFVSFVANLRRRGGASFVIRHSSFLLLALLATSCTADTTPTTTTAPYPVHFDSTPASLNNHPFTLEIASSEEQHERGLMYRSSMPADHGMIFVFNTPDNYRFWMKNTLIPLDILFLDSTGKILTIQTRKPLDETSMGPDDPALYVIELNAGAAQNIGLHPGDHIQLPEKILKPLPHSDEK